MHIKTWKRLIKYTNEIYQKHKLLIDYDWVWSHQKDDGKDDRITYNNKADKSAVQWALSKIRIPWDWGLWVRALFFKKDALDKKKWFISFLPISEEVIYIHIYAYRKLKKGFRYNYELVSREHEFFTYRSYIWYTQKTLSAWIIYLVKINSNNQIEEIVSEHTKQEIKEKMIKAWIDTGILHWKLGEK